MADFFAVGFGLWGAAFTLRKIHTATKHAYSFLYFFVLQHPFIVLYHAVIVNEIW